MPLTPDEFETRQQNVGTAVYWFLKSHAPIAFSAEEIMFELGALSIIHDLDSIVRAVALLEQRERIESVAAGGTLYYRYWRQMGFRPPRT